MVKTDAVNLVIVLVERVQGVSVSQLPNLDRLIGSAVRKTEVLDFQMLLKFGIKKNMIFRNEHYQDAKCRLFGENVTHSTHEP